MRTWTQEELLEAKRVENRIREICNACGHQRILHDTRFTRGRGCGKLLFSTDPKGEFKTDECQCPGYE